MYYKIEKENQKKLYTVVRFSPTVKAYPIFGEKKKEAKNNMKTQWMFKIY